MALLADDTEVLLERIVSRCRERLPEDDGEQAAEFARQYYDWVPVDYLENRTAIDAYGAVLAHWGFAHQRTAGAAKVRAYNPVFETHGWQSAHTIVEVVSDDMPFLVDSMTMELRHLGYAVHFVINAVMRVRRDAVGQLTEVLTPDEPGEGAGSESVIHLEISRQTQPAALEELRESLCHVLGEVRKAVEDWPAMRERVGHLAHELTSGRGGPGPRGSDRAEARAFLEWLDADHFTFLGYREYDLVTEDGEDRLRRVPGTGLGILRDEEGDGPLQSKGFSRLTSEARRLVRDPHAIYLTKANTRSTIHRPSHLDYVGIKRFDDRGRVIGEHRLLGLYTSSAYSTSAREIPIVRRKVDRVLERVPFQPASHNHKALVDILETYRRDELFEIRDEELFDIAMGILHLGERQRVRLFVRHEVYGRFVSCLVFVPRDRYNTENRERIQEVLRSAFHGKSVDYSARISESVHARLNLIVHVEPGELPPYDVAKIERRLMEVTGLWRDDLAEALVEAHGEEVGAARLRRYGDAFSPAYRAEFVARAAVSDIDAIEDLAPRGDIGMSLYRPLEAPEGLLRFKLFRSGEPVSLSRVVPLFENMGVRVTDERPYEVKVHDSSPVWIYDFGLTYGSDGEIPPEEVKELFQEAFARVWSGDVDNDGFNRLVLKARLTWREITVLRAVCKYLRQAGIAFSQGYMERTVAGNDGVARLLVELFRARFDPAPSIRQREPERIVEAIEEALQDVPSLDEDRILRRFLSVVQAMLRTNWFQADASGEPKPHLSFKLDPAQVPGLPLPRPMYEVFVSSPRMEGVHLRGGKVARGGIRWSDRREDFRTEVLGLMKAQMVKNAVIVPVGAKGGFVVKSAVRGDRAALAEEAERCYRTLIRGLLDLTDDIVEGKIVSPPNVVRYDGDDPYLVVAADKGTASFSDVANEISAEYGFWLGDAFASGGSTGYDHKAMGITARGAWKAVERHFRELGVDIASTDFSVAGIGDMAGDVFGNGMLLSPHIRLVAAFNHQHVFIDPEPDAQAGFRERERLFGLPRSSWADYERGLISKGGGVFSRSAKSIRTSPEIRAALGIEATTVSPNELVRAVLKAPVDLLWNGGIGTYVKASGETHADAGDRANDSVRVNGDELRCRVIGEGGNLGLTQLGRIEFALAGGRLNTDAIDNSGGVDCSDREVNIKILLDTAVADGDLTQKQRNMLLAEMTDEVAALVLADNYSHTQALAMSRAQAPSFLDVHARLIRALEHAGRLDRELERLPAPDVIVSRKAAEVGLTVPELAVLLAMSKISIYEELLDSDVPEDPYLSSDLGRYFPPPLPERFGERMRAHRLRREIIATNITNSMVNRAGITFAFRLGEETGAPASHIARAYAVALDVFDLRGMWRTIEELDNVVATEVQMRMFLEVRKLFERATRWLLSNRRGPLDIAACVSSFEDGARAVAAAVPELLVDSDREALAAMTDELAEAGVPAPLAQCVAGLGATYSALDIVEVARAGGHTVEAVAEVHFTLGSRLQLHALRDRIATLRRDDRWSALARAALRDDLHSQHRALTAEVLQTGADEAGVEARIDAWLEQNAPAVEHALQVLSDIKAAGTYDLATLSVALREMRLLIRSSGIDVAA